MRNLAVRIRTQVDNRKKYLMALYLQVNGNIAVEKTEPLKLRCSRLITYFSVWSSLISDLSVWPNDVLTDVPACEKLLLIVLIILLKKKRILLFK